ncbi:MAG: response regulator [Gammaproteobacteria bacterium]|nr:response regulator [Gammaproteobacteria bacterium]MBU1977747.1 response regulator [Gammaproteobacteria bacterium]
MYHIILVDDEQNILNALRRQFASPSFQDTEHSKFQVEIFTSPQQALKRAEEGVAFDLVISDYRMPEMDGVAFLKAFKRIQPNAERLILSGYADLEALVGAINEAQIFRFITKPWHDYELKSAVAQALAHRDLLRDNQQLADQVRLQRGVISRQEMALRRLEEESPGITKVHWGEDGSVIFDETDLSDDAAQEADKWLNSTK